MCLSPIIWKSWELIDPGIHSTGTCSASSIWCCKPLTSSASCCVVCRIDTPPATAVLCGKKKAIEKRETTWQLFTEKKSHTLFTWSKCHMSLASSPSLGSTASHTLHRTATRPARRCHSDRHGPASLRKSWRFSRMNRNSMEFLILVLLRIFRKHHPQYSQNVSWICFDIFFKWSRIIPCTCLKILQKHPHGGALFLPTPSPAKESFGPDIRDIPLVVSNPSHPPGRNKVTGRWPPWMTGPVDLLTADQDG